MKSTPVKWKKGPQGLHTLKIKLGNSLTYYPTIPFNIKKRTLPTINYLECYDHTGKAELPFLSLLHSPIL